MTEHTWVVIMGSFRPPFKLRGGRAGFQVYRHVASAPHTCLTSKGPSSDLLPRSLARVYVHPNAAPPPTVAAKALTGQPFLPLRSRGGVTPCTYLVSWEKPLDIGLPWAAFSFTSKDAGQKGPSGARGADKPQEHQQQQQQHPQLQQQQHQQQQQQLQAEDKRNHRRSDSCNCCSLQPAVAARRRGLRCCCLCPFNDCRGPIAHALLKALGEGNLSTEAPSMQQQRHEQPEQQQQQQQGQQSFVSREQEETGSKRQIEVDRIDSERKTENTLESSPSPERKGAAKSQHMKERGRPYAEEQEHRETEGASTAAKEQQSFLCILKNVAGGHTSVVRSLVKLPLPAPPSAPQMFETAWKPSATKPFNGRSSSRGVPSDVYAPCLQLLVPRDSLLFESRFDSGNLLAAVRGICEPNVYLLVLRPDAKRNNKTSWFFFSVTAPERGGGSQGEEGPLTVTKETANRQQAASSNLAFSPLFKQLSPEWVLAALVSPLSLYCSFKILNLVKSNSFYSRGLGPPFVFSSEAFRDRREGWRRSQGSVRFYRNSAAAAVNYILGGTSPSIPAATTGVVGDGTGSASPPSVPAAASGGGVGAAAAAGDAVCGVQHWTYDAASPALDLRGSYFSMEFKHTFDGPDKVFFASCLPYTFTDVLELTAALQTDPLAKQYCAVQSLCLSPGGLPCPVFLIGNPPRGRGSLLQQHQQLRLQPCLKPFVLSPSAFFFDPLNASGCRSGDSSGGPPDYTGPVRKVAAKEEKAGRGPLGGRTRQTAPASANQEESSRSRNNNFINSSEGSCSRNRSSVGDESSCSSSSSSKTRASPRRLMEARLLSSSESCGVCRGAPKPSVCISCRVHPSESNSSYVFLGLLSFLLSEAPEARLLRCLFTFVCVPCLNPDGVAGGLSRCNLHGDDLNRVWEGPCPVVHSTVFAFKQLIGQLKHACSPALLLLDLHGHSNKSDVFMPTGLAAAVALHLLLHLPSARHANCTEQQLCPEGSLLLPCDGSPVVSPSPSSKGSPPTPLGASCPQGGPSRDPPPNIKGCRARACAFKVSLDVAQDTAARGGPCSTRSAEAMEEALQRRGENEGGDPTSLGPSQPACASPPAESEGPLDAAVSPGGSFNKIPGAAPGLRSPDEQPEGPLLEEAPPSCSSNGRPYGRALPAKSANLLHFDAGSLMLTGVSVGLALYDWALQILKGAPGLLQPGGPPLASSGKPLMGSTKACPRCILLGRVELASPVSPGCSTKACGGLFRRGGPRRRRHDSAGSSLYAPWASPLNEEAGASGAPAASCLRGPPHRTLQPEGSCAGVSSSPSCDLEGPPHAVSTGPPLEGGPPVQTAQAAARVATSAVRRSLNFFASRASAAGREFEGSAQAAASSSSTTRLTEGVLLLDPPAPIGGPPPGLPRGPSKNDKAARGFFRGSGRSRGTAVAAAAAATSAAAAAGRHGRGIRAADILASPVALGAPQGPPQPAKMGPLGFRGDSKTAGARLRLGMKASGKGPLAEVLRCSRSAGAICSEGPHRGSRRSCCEEGPLESELVAFAIQGPPSRASQPSRWEGFEDVPGAFYDSTETRDLCGSSEKGPLAGLRASCPGCTACSIESCHQAAPHAVEPRVQQPLWQQRLPGSTAVRGPELEWALDCMTAVTTELSETKNSSRQKPLLHAAPTQHAQELVIAGERSPRQTPLSAGARCSPTWIEGDEGCRCSQNPEDPLDLKDANTILGPPLSWGAPSASGSSFKSSQETVRPEGPDGLTEAPGAPQRKSFRNPCPHIVPASAGAPQGSLRGSAAGMGGPLFSLRASTGSPPLPRGPLPWLEGPTVTRVTPTLRPRRRCRRREGAFENAPGQAASGGPPDEAGGGGPSGDV
ncbi:hypothetical protein Emag_000277 [Eimeria magna]